MELSDNRWEKQLQIKNNEKDEATRMLNNYKKKIDQLTEKVDALFAKPLSYQTPPQSPESQNSSDQIHQEAHK